MKPTALGAVSLAIGALVALTAACSGGTTAAGSTTSTVTTAPKVVATVAGEPVTEAQVTTLATDPGYRSALHLAAPAGDLATSPAGRTTLNVLIAEKAVQHALSVAGLKVDTATRKNAADIVDAKANTADGAGRDLDTAPRPSRDARAVMTAALAEYLTLDAAVRAGTSPTLTAAATMSAPGATDRWCGAYTAVRPEVAATVRAAVASGSPLDAAAAATGPAPIATSSGAKCILDAEIPSKVRAAVTGTFPGQVAQVDTTTDDGATVTLFAQPSRSTTPATPDEVKAATDRLAEKYRTSGHAAWWHATAARTPVNVDPAWGTWDPLTATVVDKIARNTFTPAPAPSDRTPRKDPPADTTPPGLSEHIYDTIDPGPSNPQARARAAIDSAVPAVWRNAVPISLSVIGGTSSLSSEDNRLRLGSYHLSGPWWRLQGVAAHEFGHHIAFDYGQQEPYGASPAGWPSSGSNPVERWADCTSRAFTGVASTSHGMGPCTGASLTWATRWLAQGPAAHPRTGR